MQDDQGNETVGNSAITPSGQPGAPTIGGPDPATLERIREHMARSSPDPTIDPALSRSLPTVNPAPSSSGQEPDEAVVGGHAHV